MISIRDLHFQYSDEQPLFDDFSLQVQTGELFGLVGPNGAGKSTLISLICGLNKPASGNILIDDKNLSRDKKTVLQKIAVVPQDYAFYPKLSARENLDFFAHLYPDLKNIEQRIEEVIQITGLAG
ncbi:MAG: ABC transporter ATP-binding protein, partial [Thioalkalispiraceae bacterium]